MNANPYDPPQEIVRAEFSSPQLSVVETLLALAIVGGTLSLLALLVVLSGGHWFWLTLLAVTVLGFTLSAFDGLRRR